jgi:aspartate/methionine/tyrosine aminotransferase
VVIGSFSKSLALPGDRVGFLAAHPRVIEETLKVQDAAVVCAPHAGQLAVTACLEWSGLDAWSGERRGELNARVGAFRETFSAGRVLAAGAFFAYIEGPDLTADRLATDAHVLALPGAAFGSSETDRVRIAVGNAGVDEIHRAASRINRLAAES